MPRIGKGFSLLALFVLLHCGSTTAVENKTQPELAVEDIFEHLTKMLWRKDPVEMEVGVFIRPLCFYMRTRPLSSLLRTETEAQ